MEPSITLKAAVTVFDSNFGLFSAAADDHARKDVVVLFLNAWGLEGLYIHSFQRVLAERFAAIGIASLRFDFPGSGNAPDLPADDMTLDAWRASVHAAARELRRLSGVSNIVLLGHGIGASIAFLEAGAIDDLAGLILMNPVVSGRRYLRDLSVLAKFFNNTLGLKPEQHDSAPGSIAGLRMAPQIAAQIRSMDLKKAPPLGARMPILIASQPAGPDQGWPASLVTNGHKVDAIRYEGYDHLVSGSLPPLIPHIMADRLCVWLRDLQAAPAAAEMPPQAPLAEPVTFGAARETPVRFGGGNGLFGTVCEPVGHATGVAVLILTTGYDPQSGWGRSAAELARQLSARGIASLRFDSAGVGNSPPIPGRRRQILYDPEQNEDVRLAFAYLQEHLRPSRSMVVGRCSGAYVAFRAAMSDPNWDACVVINPPDFWWRFRGLPRTVSAYAAKLRKPGLGKALLAGEIDARSALHNVAVRLIDRAAGLAGRAVPAALTVVRRSRRVMSDFRTLAGRNTRVTILYSEGDEGEGNFRIHFGPNGERLAAFPNVRIQRIPDADHNVTPLPAREIMFAAIERQALDLVPAPAVMEKPALALPERSPPLPAGAESASRPS